MAEPPSLALVPIGYVHTPWPEKFGVPRQSGMADNVVAQVQLDPDRIPREALRGLEQVSHLWLVTWMHGTSDEGWRPTVRPPRLGGAQRLGVLATRSPHRPNPIGLSVVRLLGVGDRVLEVSGVDLLDGTPVLDIKPYLPWADLVPQARCAWAEQGPPSLEVRVGAEAEAQMSAHPQAELLRRVIVETLCWDPRPAHQRGEVGRVYAVRVLDVDVRFRVDVGGVDVLAVELV